MIKTLLVIDSIWCDLSKRTSGAINITFVYPFFVFISFFVLCFFVPNPHFETLLISSLLIGALVTFIFYVIISSFSFEWGKKRSLFKYMAQHQKRVNEDIEKEIKQKEEDIKELMGKLKKYGN